MPRRRGRRGRRGRRRDRCRQLRGPTRRPRRRDARRAGRSGRSTRGWRRRSRRSGRDARDHSGAPRKKPTRCAWALRREWLAPSRRRSVPRDLVSDWLENFTFLTCHATWKGEVFQPIKIKITRYAPVAPQPLVELLRHRKPQSAASVGCNGAVDAEHRRHPADHRANAGRRLPHLRRLQRRHPHPRLPGVREPELPGAARVAPHRGVAHP